MLREFHDIIRGWEAEARRGVFIARAGVPNNEAKAFAELAVDDITSHLVNRGYVVEATKDQAKIDLIVTNEAGQSISIEVKASTFKNRADGRGGRYQGRLKPGQREAADLVALGCDTWWGWEWFLIPSDKVTGQTINISQADPNEYQGRYRRWLGAWGILSKLFGGK